MTKEPTTLGPSYEKRVLRPGALTVEAVYRRYRWNTTTGTWDDQDFMVLERPYALSFQLLAVTVTPLHQDLPMIVYLADLGVVPGADNKMTDQSYIVIVRQPRR